MFDLHKLTLNKKKSVQFVQNSPLIRFIHEDLIERLLPIDRVFQNILLINPPIENILSVALQQKYPNHKLTVVDSYTKIPSNKFDLVIFPMGLHWVNDIQIFLKTICQSLQAGGVFMANFFGGGSLQKLRYKLMELEAVNGMAHAPHISPFIRFEQLVPLLQQAGFSENVIDHEILNIEQDSALGFMKMLQNIGESNVLMRGISYSINKNMYEELKHKQQGGFHDHINLITFLSSPSQKSIKLKSEHFHG